MTEAMLLAIKKAKQTMNENIGGPFGAAIIDKDGNIIALESNRVLGDHDPTAHAEVMAIREACKNINSYDLSGCELYTTCYPCPMCLSAIIWSNIKVVYYGNTKEDAANIGFRDDYIYNYIGNLSKNMQDNSVLELNCMDRNETIEEFNKFVSKSDKIIY